MSDTTHGTGRAYADNLTIHERIILDIAIAEVQRNGVASLMDKGVQDWIKGGAAAVLRMMDRPE